jgi:hypothetical protein
MKSARRIQTAANPTAVNRMAGVNPLSVTK